MNKLGSLDDTFRHMPSDDFYFFHDIPENPLLKHDLMSKKHETYLFLKFWNPSVWDIFFGLASLFDAISIFMGYLMPNPLF